MYTASFYIEPQDILNRLSEEDRERFNHCVFYDVQRDMTGLRITCLLIEDKDVNEAKYSYRFFDENTIELKD